jgi:amino acid transporter
MRGPEVRAPGSPQGGTEVESAAVPAKGETSKRSSAPGEKGLKTGAIGYASNVVIAVASTAPAYSLAATLGFVVAVGGLGTHAPAILIVSFIPILFVSLGYRWLNLADPDAGTTFAWVTRALGPQLGWINGWAIFLADVIVMASLSVVAAKYTFLLVGATGASTSTPALLIAAVVWIALMTWICWRGIELSARIQMFLLSFEVAILALFAIVALVKVYTGHPVGSIHPQLAWFNPFDLSLTTLAGGVLLGIFIYWGWDSGVAVNEESKNGAEGPGRAAVVSTVLLLVIYVLVGTGAQAIHGTAFLTSPAHQQEVLSPLATAVFGSGVLQKLMIIAVLTSASASTQTTILPTARTTISMASWGAIPRIFGRTHVRFQTPDVSTIAMGVVSTIWTIGIVAFDPNQNVLGDSITALGFAICFYYGFTGIACAVYFRRELFRDLRRFFLVGVVPVLGGGLMFYVFVKAYLSYSKSGVNYSPPLDGLQVPIVIGIGGLLLGVLLMFASWPFMREYFGRRPYFEAADPKVLEEHFAREK